MKPAAVRVAVLLVLALTVVVRFHSLALRDATAASFNAGSAVEALVRENGLAVQDNSKSVVQGAIYFQRPECAHVSIALPFDMNFEAAPLLARIAPSASYTYRFFYLDRSWAEQDRLQIFTEWLKHSALGLAGASRFVPVKTFIAVAEPSACETVVRVDWQSVWDRGRYQARTARGSPANDADKASGHFHAGS
jgi:hypothetical protein